MPDIQKAILSSATGPIFEPRTEKKTREHYNPVEGETCSRTDDVFKDKTSQQKLRFKDVAYENPLPVPNFPNAVEKLVTPRAYKKQLEEHFERRVQFFFQQLIVCYQTKLVFESVGARDQGSSPDSIKVKSQGKQKNVVARNAAHSAGNPRLIAYDRKEWRLYKEEKINKPNGFIFLKGTDFYRTANSTMNLPKWVNEADREIDEKWIESQLRERGNQLINQCSQGIITPDEGLNRYLKIAKEEIEKGRERLANIEKRKNEVEVLCYYSETLDNIKKYINKDPNFFSKFLNLSISDEKYASEAKRELFKHRYAAIRDCQLEQYKLIEKVDRVQNQILHNIKKEKGSKKPGKFTAAFKQLVIEQTNPQTASRARLEKLFNFSPSNYNAQLTSQSKALYNKTIEVLSHYHREIRSLARELLNDMESLRTKEMDNRGATIELLSRVTGWSQREIGRQLKNKFPMAAASQTTIWRIIHREKFVTKTIAHQFSVVFEVDPDLFMPQFFYD